MPFNLKNFLLGLVSGPVIEAGSEQFEVMLEKFWAKHPKAATAFAVSLYIGIDLFLEDYAQSTSTGIDDKAVAELKEDIEAFAALHDISLSNLDEDKTNV